MRIPGFSPATCESLMGPLRTGYVDAEPATSVVELQHTLGRHIDALNSWQPLGNGERSSLCQIPNPRNMTEPKLPPESARGSASKCPNNICPSTACRTCFSTHAATFRNACSQRSREVSFERLPLAGLTTHSPNVRKLWPPSVKFVRTRINCCPNHQCFVEFGQPSCGHRPHSTLKRVS